jgi:hypothetical protein
MPNPDGVASGCCRNTQRGGIDLCHEGANGQDMAGQSLIEFMTQVKPQAYLDLHGWMHREHDGITWSDQEHYQKIMESMKTKPVFNKQWQNDNGSEPEFRSGDFFMQASRKLGASSYIVRPSWFEREVYQMRQFGRDLLNALCETVSD